MRPLGSEALEVPTGMEVCMMHTGMLTEDMIMGNTEAMTSIGMTLKIVQMRISKDVNPNKAPNDIAGPMTMLALQDQCFNTGDISGEGRHSFCPYEYNFIIHDAKI